MLEQLQIRDFAIIDQVELDWRAGMTALTGETGAGKSILIDAIALVLGGRADPGAVREGAARAEIVASFELGANAAARAWLVEQALDQGEQCVLRRVIGADGRSRAWINGRASTATALRSLGALLVQILGQHEHQRLGERDYQRALLDARAGHTDQLPALATAHRRWRAALARRETRREHAQSLAQRRELLAFQLEALDQFPWSAEEIEALQREGQRLGRAGECLQRANAALQSTDDGEHSARTALSAALREAEALAAVDREAGAAVGLLGDALIHLDEAATALREHAAAVELDPARLAWVEEQLGALGRLAHKHRCTPGELPALRERLRDEFEALEAERDDTALDAELAALQADYLERARTVSAARRAAADELGAAVSEAIQALGMGGARLQVALCQEPARGGPSGIDEVEFTVAANPGQRPRPIARVASGGELARLALAIHLIASRDAPTPSMVFDEVDAGIGGAVAESVGEQLRALGERCQVMCVTHLPQVASRAHHHWAVRKCDAGGYTHTQPQRLGKRARVEEIARMLGGAEITARARSHARELLADQAA